MLASLIIALAIIVLQAPASGQTNDSSLRFAVEKSGKRTYVSGELIVTYKANTSKSRKSEIVKRSRGKTREKLVGLNARVVSFPKIKAKQSSKARKAALRRTKKRLERASNVKTVDYDYVRKAFFEPNDPDFEQQWGLERVGFPQAWDAQQGGANVRIAIVDTGIAQNHPDFDAGKVVAQRDFVNGDTIAEDPVADGHGTHVAGIASASTGNNEGIAGGCPNCDLIVAKSLQGAAGTDSDIAEGIRWAADQDADVINLSLGGPGYSEALEQAVNYAYRQGAVIVAAAGNSGDNTVSYPAAFPRALAVSATDRDDTLASFSTRNGWVDIAAPGVAIYSTVPGGYDSFNGTSMAAPHVAALVGLLSAEGLSNTGIRLRILNTAEDLGPEGRDRFFGAGIIDADEAVNGEPSPPLTWGS